MAGRVYRLTKTEVREEAQDQIYRLITEGIEHLSEIANDPDGDFDRNGHGFDPISPRIGQHNIDVVVLAMVEEGQKIGKRFKIVD